MPSASSFTRRHVLAGSTALLASQSLFPHLAVAQNARNFPLAQLLEPNALPDIWQGKDDAPVTIIEYASTTCSHCATFHNTTYKQLKEKYIDTGKARLTVREFPFDPLSMAGPRAQPSAGSTAGSGQSCLAGGRRIRAGVSARCAVDH